MISPTLTFILGFVFMLLCFIPVHVKHAATCNLFDHQDQCNAINLSNINVQNSKTIFRRTLKENNLFLLSKNMMQHYSTTDSKILFLFREKPPLTVFSEKIDRLSTRVPISNSGLPQLVPCPRT